MSSASVSESSPRLSSCSSSSTELEGDTPGSEASSSALALRLVEGSGEVLTMITSSDSCMPELNMSR